uniref:Uncharacterized protein n=1 Tax=Oryza sativa subsp. japonica TaxID=39947 RepID=Q5Z4B7_ORYSJ|nr:hypothetical protein [Oryza sativa Japonica Group]
MGEGLRLYPRPHPTTALARGCRRSLCPPSHAGRHPPGCLGGTTRSCSEVAVGSRIRPMCKEQPSSARACGEWGDWGFTHVKEGGDSAGRREIPPAGWVLGSRAPRIRGRGEEFGGPPILGLP